MAIVIYEGFRRDLIAGAVTGSTDVRALAVMSNSTAEGDEDAVNLDDIGTLDEFDGSGYSRADLSSVAVTHDATNNITRVTADPANFGSAVDAGTRQVIGIIYYRHVAGGDANCVAWAFNDSGELPGDPQGGDFIVSVDDGVVTMG